MKYQPNADSARAYGEPFVVSTIAGIRKDFNDPFLPLLLKGVIIVLFVEGVPLWLQKIELSFSIEKVIKYKLSCYAM